MVLASILRYASTSRMTDHSPPTEGANEESERHQPMSNPELMYLYFFQIIAQIAASGLVNGCEKCTEMHANRRASAALVQVNEGHVEHL